METIIAVLFSALGTGGFVAVIQVIANRHKNKSEVTDINVKTAIELEKVAMTRYNDISQRLASAEIDFLEIKKVLREAREEIDIYKNYCEILKDLLHKNNIEIPAIKKGL